MLISQLLSLSSLSILLLIWLDLCLSQLAPTSFKSNPREWGFHCPNDCNKRGICTKGDICMCQNNWHGPDCSIANCPWDYSYNSKPTDFNIAHSKTECSSQGICDYNTGKCNCFPGFEGTACQQQSCKDSSGSICSGHGTCMTIDDIYKYYTAKSTSSPSKYLSWEAGHTSTCVCQDGYTGAACQIRMCPKGDDPLTPKTGYRVITLTTTASGGTLGGNFLFYVNQHSIRIPAKASLWSADACVTAFQSIPVIGKVTCTKSADNGAGGATYTITIKSYPVYPKDNNIFPLDGTLNTGIFGCDVSMATGSNPSCIIADATPGGTLLPEYAMCSNRGNCDISTGNCVCASPLFYGPNCGAYRIVDIITKVPNPVDILKIEISNAAYTNTILGLYGMIGGNYPQNTGILPWTPFNTTLMKVFDYSDDSPVDKDKIYIDAEGNIKSVAGWRMLGTSSSGITVRANGLVSWNGMTVNGILNVTTKKDDTDIYAARFLDTSNRVEITGGLKVNPDQRTALSYDVRIYTNGIKIGMGGITTGSIFDKAYVDTGLIINAGGGTISAGGLYVTGGVNVSAGGMFSYRKSTVTIGNTGLRVFDGMTIQSEQIRAAGQGGAVTGYDGALIFAATGVNSSFTGGLTLTGGITSGNIGLTVKGGTTISSMGLNVLANGATISDNGLNVYGGITISPSPTPVQNNMIVSGGGLRLYDRYDIGQAFNVRGGATVYSDGLYVMTKGLTVADSGLYIATQGLTISNEGLYVTAKGMTIVNGGLVNSAGGFTSNSGGLYVTQGMTVANEGLIIVNKGLSVVAAGLSYDGTFQNNIIYDGISVGSIGLKVTTGGATVNSGGLVVTTKGLTVSNQGLYITLKGLTVNAGGIVLTAGGLSVSDKLKITSPEVNKIKTGLTVTNGITVTAGNVNIVAKGLSIPNGGLTVSGLYTEANGLKVINGGLSVGDIGLVSSNAATINEGLIVSLKGVTVKNLGITIADSLSIGTYLLVNTLGLRITTRGAKVNAANGGNSVGAGGASIKYGVSIANHGLVITTKGLTVKDLGLIIKNGMTIASNGITLAGGLTIQSGAVSLSGLSKIDSANALKVTGGMTVSDTGLVITTKGVTISNGGLVVSDKGLTVSTKGLQLTGGGLTINNLGSTISGLVKLSDQDISTYALTIQAGGLTITNDDITIGGGLNVGNGLTLNDGLLVSNDGATVGSGGLAVTTKGLTIKREGLVVAGGLTVDSGSLQVSGGITVYSGGVVYSPLTTAGGANKVEVLSVTGGLTVTTAGMSVRARSSTNNVYSGGLKVLDGGLTVYGIATGFCNGCSGYSTAGAITSPFSNNPLMPGTVAATALPSLSDRQMKTNFTVIEDSLGIVRKLRGFKFDWISDPPEGFHFDQKRHLGLMAQDVQDVLPDLVSSRNGTYLEVNYMEIIPVLIDAVTKLKHRIDTDKNCSTVANSDRNKLIEDLYSLKTQIISLENDFNAFKKESENYNI